MSEGTQDFVLDLARIVAWPTVVLIAVVIFAIVYYKLEK